MSRLASFPRATEVAISLLILLGGYLAARLVSFLFRKILGRAAARTATQLDDRLVRALEHPLTYVLVLVAAWAAIHRLPLPAAVMAGSDKVLFVLAVFLVTLAVVRAFDILLGWWGTESRLAKERELALEFTPLLGKVGKVFLGLVAAITILHRFSVDVASLVVSLGVGSLAVGLAAQDTLSNMFAGFTLMIDRPFRVGHRIQLASGETGDVESIGMRATCIRTPDDTLLVVPNSTLVKERLTNLTYSSRRLVTHVDVTCAYGSDAAVARRILEEAALACPATDPERPPTVLVTRLSDLGLQLQLTFRVLDYADQGQAKSEVLEAIHRRLAEAGIDIATAVRPVEAPPREPGRQPGVRV